MFSIIKQKIIIKNSRKYLSFPDAIKDINNPDILFLIYRSGDSHHPTNSKLVFMISRDKGETWKIKKEFLLSLEKNNYVWNCPRLSYIDDALYIVCDQKSGIFERVANFKISFLSTKQGGDFFEYTETFIPGMVPDKIIKFKNKLFCANHKIKSTNNDLVQLVSWSRDNGKTWFDTNIIADSNNKRYCEASLVNIDDKYLMAYLRDNSGHYKPIYYTKSKDGIYWDEPKKLGNIIGQRVTAIRENDYIIGTYRNTEEAKISLFYHPINEENKVKKIDIDSEYKQNLYHFGYTGIEKTDNNKFIIVYYIKNDEPNPFIKMTQIKKI